MAEREITTKVRDKTFIGSTVFLLLIVLASIVIPALISGSDGPDKVAVVDPLGTAVVKRADQVAGGGAYEARQLAGVPEAERLVSDGDVDAALVPGDGGYTVVGGSEVDSDLLASLREALLAQQTERNAAGAGLTPDELRAGSGLTERLLDPGPIPPLVAELASIGLAIVFYMTALGFGMMIAQSVVQEKESRVVEILAAAVPIRALLWGKVLGNSIMALAQITVIAIAAIIGLTAIDRDDLLSVIAPVSGWFVVYFVLGFVALASLWAVAGSIATRQEDLQSTTLPGQMILLLPFFFSVFAGDSAKTVASFVPIASSMAMPGRMLTEDVPLWQPLVSIAILIAATVGLVAGGARLYERTLLQTGRRMGYREAIAQKAE
ncbi:MAG TPA: ABC transporter permease [Kribbellaceae bacterium]|nr:ABC transporter permease [Kribbellaceae bacterium]